MNFDDHTLRFFLGANTPQGFVSRFDQLTPEDEDGWREYIIKGGPGCGKSTLMQKAARQLTADSLDIELIHCSSDVDSLDGVIAPCLKFCIADGTAPHVIEPKYPGAFESLISMSDCWDNDRLYACRSEIIRLSQSNTRCHEYCCRFLSAAASLAGDTYRAALDCVDTAKLSGYCSRLAQREFKPVKKSAGKEKIRFLTAVTNKGVIKFTGTAKALCDRIYLINDEYGAVSRLLLHSVRSSALSAGYDIISCYCPLSPFDKLEQLFIPQLRLGFMTSNRFHDFTMEIDPYRVVNSQRFTLADEFKSRKKRISFNRRAVAQMIRQAELLLAEAKEIHDELESYYKLATDFKKVNKLSDQVLAQLGKIQKEQMS